MTPEEQAMEEVAEWKEAQAKQQSGAAVGCSALLESLALRLERRAIDINCAHAWTEEERAVRRSMIVIYREIAEMLRAETEKLSNEKVRGARP